MEIWTTVACSKTRAALDELGRYDVNYTRRSCMEEPPTAAEIEDVLDRLGMEPWEVARPQESREAGFADLPKDRDGRDSWVQALVAHPHCIQRPIVLLDDGSAVIARDAETLNRILG